MSPQPPNPYPKILISKVMIHRGELFQKELGHEGGALINVLVPLVKEQETESLPCSTMCGHKKKIQIRKISLTRTHPDHAGILILDSSLQNCEK